MPRLRSLQVGRVAPLGGPSSGRRSGIDERPVDGARALAGLLGLSPSWRDPFLDRIPKASAS